MQIQQRYLGAEECVGTPSAQEATQAFGQILSTQLPTLYRRAYRLLGNKDDAEDALQDALLAAYTHLDQFKGESRMSTWITTIVHNSARTQLRKRRHHFQVPLKEISRCANGWRIIGPVQSMNAVPPNSAPI